MFVRTKAYTMIKAVPQVLENFILFYYFAMMLWYMVLYKTNKKFTVDSICEASII